MQNWMRSRGARWTGLLALVVLAGPVLAQIPSPPSPNQNPGGAATSAPVIRRLSEAEAPVDSLDYALKLTAEQKQKISAIQAQFRKVRDALLPHAGPGNQPPDPDELKEKLADLQPFERQAGIDIRTLLTAEQRNSLPDALQVMTALRAVGLSPELYGLLKITSPQGRAIAAFARESQAPLSPTGADKPVRGDRAVADALRQARERERVKSLAALTPDQRRTAEAYVKTHPEPALEEAFAFVPAAGPGAPAAAGGAAQAAAAGAGVFRQRCQMCHGAQGRGGRAPALINLANSSDADLYQTIHDGRKNKMPPFGTLLSDAQISGVIQYLRQLAPQR